MLDYYGSPAIQRLMVEDSVRTNAFRRAIQAAVKPGMVVLDAGAGSGILSLFAAQAGAARVYAVERAAGAAALARRMAADNGFQHVIRVIESDLATAWLPEPVQVLVSEWLGAYGVDENMLAPVLLARDRWLAPDGAMIPSSVTAWLAPVDHAASREAVQLRTNPYGLDLRALDPNDWNQAISVAEGLQTADLRAAPQVLWVTDCAKMPSHVAHQPYAAELDFELSGSATALAAWFSAELPGADAPLSNGPGQPRTHWGILLFPFAGAAACKAGTRVQAGFHNVPATAYGSQHIWAARVGEDGLLEVYDTRRRRNRQEPPWRAYLPEGASRHE